MKREYRYRETLVLTSAVAPRRLPLPLPLPLPVMSSASSPPESFSSVSSYCESEPSSHACHPP